MAGTRTTKPKTKIALNLDALEREDAAEPFVVVVGGKEVEFIDPAELDWEELAEFDSPRDFVNMALDDESRDHVLAQKLPGWKFKALWDGYQAHFGVDNRGNASA